MKNLPELFIERLQKIIPQKYFDDVLRSFEVSKPITARINTIKKDPDEIKAVLQEQGVSSGVVSWNDNALVFRDISRQELADISLFKEGVLYRQGLSSMLVPAIFGPVQGEDILDMCSAPGSKTTQIAAMMGNSGSIVAVENIKGRFYRLKSVVALLGASNVTVKLIDARKFRSDRTFDRILVDAPCSSEGRFNLQNKKTYAYWSLRKIREMRKKQRGILLNAFRLLKKNGTLVYSTCTFAPEENEGVVDWLLRKTDKGVAVEKIPLTEIKTYPCLLGWDEREFAPEVNNCLRILPGELMDGFFIARMRKL